MRKSNFDLYWRALVGTKSAVQVVRASQAKGQSVLEYLLRAHVRARKPLPNQQERDAFDAQGLKYLSSMYEEITAVLTMEAHGRAENALEGLQQPQGATKDPGGMHG